MSIFNDSPQVGNSACKPDPEEMLQHCRKTIEACKRAEEILMELDSVPVYVDVDHEARRSFQIFVGAYRIKRLQATADQDKWLKEIDKEAKP